MGRLFQDIQYSFRLGGKNSGFVLVVVLTLALGIGANTAIFSVVNGVLLKPLPYGEPENVVRIWREFQAMGEGPVAVSSSDYLAWRDGSQLLDGMAAYIAREFDVSFDPGAEPEKLLGAEASHDLFDVLRVQPRRGRMFTKEEADGSVPVVIISHALWRSRFAGSEDILDRSLSTDGSPHSIIGVMPPGFQFPLQGEFWTPRTFQPVITLTNSGGRKQRRFTLAMLNVVGRVRRGVKVDRLREELQTISDNPQSSGGFSFGGERPVRVQSFLDTIVGKTRPVLFLISGAVLLVLLIACANVANLLLAQAASREREFAVRSALGAGRWRLIRQLVTESLLLASLGGVAGTLLAYIGLRVFLVAPPIDIPRVGGIGLDGPVLGFSVGVSLLTGLLFGVAPAFRASRLELTKSLKEGATHSAAGLNLLRRNRFRAALVAAEVAFSLILLIGAGLLLNSFLRMAFNEPGFKPQNLLVGSPRPRPGTISGGNFAESVGALYEDMLNRITALPGVQSAALTTFAPPKKVASEFPVIAEGQFVSSGEEAPKFPALNVSSDYFTAMGIPLKEGRVFSREDADIQGVVILNELAARRLLPDQDAVGKLLFLNDDVAQVVGVVGNVRQEGLDHELTPALYLPTQSGGIELGSGGAGGARIRMIRMMSLLVRTEGDPVALAGHIRSAVKDAGMNLSELQLMDQTLWQSIAQPRFYSLLFGTFALVALLLAAVGIFGVMSYSVSQSTHEIGIRMALGAQTPSIVGMVVRQGVIISLVGIAVGLAGAFALTRFLESLLFGVTATDPVTFLGICFLFLGVALAACYLPARRATKVDPMVALRYE